MPEVSDRVPPPLAGVTVVDLSQIYNGPYATFLLAMGGAHVIKVEPLDGEHLRRRSAVGGAALPFAMLNANKHPVTLNLKSADGRELLLQMVRRADVLVENFAPGVMDRLGLGWPQLQAANRRLIYASSSGFGSSGPSRDFPAMDLTVQAMSGVMSVTGFADRPPVKAGPALCDFLAGIHLYGAIATALYERERTQVGRQVEVSMQEAVYASLASNLGLFFGSGGRVPLRTGNSHGGLAESPYNVYPTADGWIAILCAGEPQWASLARVMGRPELVQDPRFSDLKARVAHRDEVDAIVAEFTETQHKSALFQRLMAERIPCSPVRDLEEVVNDAHLHERGFLRWIDHPTLGRIVVPSSPLRFFGTPLMAHSPSRGLGSDNDAIYREWLGLPADSLAELKRNGVI